MPVAPESNTHQQTHAPINCATRIELTRAEMNCKKHNNRQPHSTQRKMSSTPAPKNQSPTSRSHSGIDAQQSLKSTARMLFFFWQYQIENEWTHKFEANGGNEGTKPTRRSRCQPALSFHSLRTRFRPSIEASRS